MLPALKEVISHVAAKSGANTFLDPFTGSAAVSRLARQCGLKVSANDIEPFACVTASVYLSLSQEDLTKMFPFQGGIDAFYSFINLHGLYASHSKKVEGSAFLSRLYAPENEKEVRVGEERLYYTQGNALFIDAVREEIENSWLAGTITASERAVVLSSLLYQASVRANISGTFTSYHKRFYDGDTPVRSRIVEPVELTVPALCERNFPAGRVYQEDAVSFLRHVKGDICYLDPPSSPQQYGSAYHLLNTIALWDDPEVDNRVDEKGYLTDKGGIRGDWKKTKSPFCSRKDAYGAMLSLLNAVDSPHLILTYPDNGMVRTDQILEILKRKYPQVSISPLVRDMRGGKQPKGKVPVEQLFLAGDSFPFSLSLGDSMERMEQVSVIEGMRSQIFRNLTVDVKGFTLIAGAIVDTHPGYEGYALFTTEELSEIEKVFTSHLIDTPREALNHLLGIYAGEYQSLSGTDRVKLEKKVISLLRFVHGYHKELFTDIIGDMRAFHAEQKELLSSRLTFTADIEKFFLLSEKQGGEFS